MRSRRGPGTPLFLRGSHRPTTPAPQSAPVSRRHCWVHHPSGQLHEGLVQHWRSPGPGRWEALVTYVDDQQRAITQWVPASHLSPGGTRPAQQERRE